MRTVRRRPHRRRRRRAGLRGAAGGRPDGVAARGGVHSGRHRVAPLRTQAVRRQSAEAPDSHRRGEVDRWPRRSASRSRCPACRARLLAPWSPSTRGGRSPRARSRRREYRSAVEYRHRSRAPKSPGPRPRRTPRPRSHPFRRRRRGVRHRLVDAQDDLADRDLVRAAPLHELARYPTCDRYRVRRRWKLPQFVSHLGGGYPIAGWPGEPPRIADRSCCEQSAVLRRDQEVRRPCHDAAGESRPRRECPPHRRLRTARHRYASVAQRTRERALRPALTPTHRSARAPTVRVARCWLESWCARDDPEEHRGEVTRRGGEHEAMEDLVEPEAAWPRVRAARRVNRGSEHVEHTAGGEQQ
jgi:hypothetical protein